MPELHLSKKKGKELYRCFYTQTQEKKTLFWPKGARVAGVTLQHDVICHRGNKNTALRYEFVNTEKPLGTHTKNRVYRVEATLCKTGIKRRGSICRHGRIKQRLAKYTHHSFENPVKDIYEEALAANEGGFLKAKPPTVIGPKSYMIMTEVPGVELETILMQDKKYPGSLTLQQRLDLTMALLEALYNQVSRYGNIHRDIKPSNILVDRDGHGLIKQIYILDFGFVIRSGKPLVGDPGSYYYAAPEMWRKDQSKQSTKTDTYSIACVIAELWRIDMRRLKINENFLNALSTLFRDLDDLAEPDREIIRHTLSCMFADDPHSRPCLTECIEMFKKVDLGRAASQSASIAASSSEEPRLAPPSGSHLPEPSYDQLPAAHVRFFTKLSDQQPSCSQSIPSHSALKY